MCPTRSCYSCFSPCSYGSTRSHALRGSSAVTTQRTFHRLLVGCPGVSAGRSLNLNVTKTAAVVIDSGPQNTVRFGAGPLRFGLQVVARRIDVFGPFRAVIAGRIGTWVARDCHIRVKTATPRRVSPQPASLPSHGASRETWDDSAHRMTHFDTPDPMRTEPPAVRPDAH